MLSWIARHSSDTHLQWVSKNWTDNVEPWPRPTVVNIQSAALVIPQTWDRQNRTESTIKFGYLLVQNLQLHLCFIVDPTSAIPLVTGLSFVCKERTTLTRAARPDIEIGLLPAMV